MAGNKNEQQKNTGEVAPANVSPKVAKTAQLKAPDGYKLVNWPGGSRMSFGPPFGIVDLDDLSVAKAERLVSMNFPYLAKK
ncbi:MAG: hypothetical protein AAF840_08690, partial [Bacteroidota bacterium]